MTTKPTDVRHGIRNRLVFGMALTVIIGLAMTAVIYGLVVQTVTSLSERTNATNQLMVTEDSLKVAILTQETYAFDYALTHDSRPLEELDGAQTEEIDAYAELERLAPNDPELIAAATNIRTLATAWQRQWLRPFIATVQSGATVDAAQAIEESEALFAPAEEAIFELENLMAARRASTATETASTATNLASFLIPFGIAVTVLLGLLGAWLTRTISGPLQRLNRTARALVDGAPVTFEAERDDEIGALAENLEELRADAAVRYSAARQEAERAATFNQLAELTSFAQDEESLVKAAVQTLRRIAPTPRGHVMLLNNSTNRLTVAAGWGDNAVVPGMPVEIERIDRCPGIRRATAYVAPDLEDDMAVRCPIHHATSGSAVCLPMPALGSIVGVIHLERPERNAFDGETVQRAARVAEQVALAIANARLMLTMEGLAMTDPLTGLRNARFFDTYLEQAFSVAERDRQSVGLIMLDVDNFKKFNDTHGHPAGDEALRALGRSLRSLVRASDVVARYGGEEFVVALHHTTLSEARIVAEKIRVGVEQTVVDIGPGRFARITVSLGIAATDAHKVDRKGLVAIADAALYRAKEKGRNRVEAAPTTDTELGAAARCRAGRAAAARRRAGRAAAERPVPIDAKAAS